MFVFVSTMFLYLFLGVAIEELIGIFGKGKRRKAGPVRIEELPCGAPPARRKRA